MTLLVDPVAGAGAMLFISALMAGSAFHKLRDFLAFRETVRDYRIVPDAWTGPAAGSFASLELASSLLLLLAESRALGALLAAALLSIYATAIGINLSRGRTEIDCGCSWGGRGQVISRWLLVRNAALMPFVILAGVGWSPRGLGVADGLAVSATALTLMLLYHAADRLIANASGLARSGHAR